MKLDSEKLHVPPFGEASTHLRGSVTPDIDPMNYRMIARANITVANTPLFAEMVGLNECGSENTSSDNDEDPRVRFLSQLSDQTIAKSSVFQ